jgi:DNA-binding response OmpR family regulator
VLRDAGFHTLSMTDAEMTLAVLRAIRADLFMVDLSRPQTQGQDLIEKLRLDPLWAHVPIIATGARAEVDWRSLRRRIGIGEVLTDRDAAATNLIGEVRRFTASAVESADGSHQAAGSYGWNN